MLNEGLISEKDFLYKRSSILGVPFKEDLFNTNESVLDNIDVKIDTLYVENQNNKNENAGSKNRIGYIVGIVIVTAIVALAIFLVGSNYSSKIRELINNSVVEETSEVLPYDQELINRIVGVWYLPNSGSDIIVFNDNMTYSVEELSGVKQNGGTWQCIDGTITVADEVWEYDYVNETLTPMTDAAPGEHWVKIN